MYTWRLKRGERGEGAEIAGPRPPQSHHLHHSHPFRLPREIITIKDITSRGFVIICLAGKAYDDKTRGSITLRVVLTPDIYYA
jgi:hypothetical protein